MRIGFVSSELAGFHGGGIGTYVAEAGRALTAAGHEVWLITADPGPERRDALRAHRGFHRVVLFGEGVTNADRIRFETPSTARVHAMIVHATLRACGEAFDYVEFTDYLAEGFAAIRAHRLDGELADTVMSVMLHSPTHDILEWNGQRHLADPELRELCVLEDDAIRQAPVLLAPSTRLLEMAHARLGARGGQHARIVRYPMALDPEVPAPPAVRAELSQLRFLFVGRIEPRKGVHHLVEAFRALPDLRLQLVGSDAAFSPLATSFQEWLAPDLPPNVQFLPAVPRERLLELLREVDVCVLPSAWENWPNACIEAMAAARVVIGGRNGGMSEMIEHGRSGFLVDGSDPSDIASVIATDLRCSLPHLPEIGRTAALRIRELCEPARYVQAIESVVTAERAPRPADEPARSTATIVIEFRGEREDVLRSGVAEALAHDGGRHETIVVDASGEPARARGYLSGVPGAERLSVLDAPPSRRRHPRAPAIERARGACVVFLRTADRLRPDAVATILRVLDRHPEVDGVSPLAAVRGDRDETTRALRASAPFDRALAIVRGALPDVPTVLRTAVLRRTDLRLDPVLDEYADRALAMDCAALGLRIEHLPRVLFDLVDEEPDPRTPLAWQRHRALLGLLVDRHLPPGDRDAERELAALLVRSWGTAAFGSPLAELVHRTDVAVGTRLPRLAALARRLAATLLRAHGRAKDRRAGRG